MDTLTLIVLTSLAGLLIGFLVGKSLQGKAAVNKIKEAEDQSKTILKEAEVTAENLKKDKILEAKEKFLKLKSDFEEESSRKKNIILTNEQKLKQKEG